MTPGDRVHFHLIIEHDCAGVNCQCTTKAYPATVLEVIDQDEDGLEVLKLEVNLPPEAVEAGYSPIQRRSPQAFSVPIPSGSWSSLDGSSYHQAAAIKAARG